MKKPYVKILARIIVLLLCFKVFAYGGILGEQDDVRVSVTTWFDIIYSPESERSAQVIYENADRIYEEICAEYGTVPSFRMPVVLTSDNEMMNGYQNNYPYNRIVIYDTVTIEEMDVNTDHILSIFTHELTHAVTLNITSKFMLGVQKVFGDAYSLSFWLTSRGMAEGAAVSMESSKGEGRLSSEYITFMIKQAKLEGVFPEYYDIQCSEDVYPFDDLYYFNAEFNTWLQKKYGMEKYAKLWYFCVNMQAMDFAGAFSKVYGVSIFDEWNAFKAWVELPKNVVQDVLAQGYSKDFFERGSRGFSKQNETGRLYDSLIYGKRGLAYIDSACRAVFFVSVEDLQKSFNNELELIKPKRLFTLNNIQNIRFSDDGDFIIAEYITQTKGNYKKAAKIYSMQNGSTKEVLSQGVEEGVLIQKDGKAYFVYVNFESVFNSIVIAEAELSKDKKSFHKLKTPAVSQAVIHFPPQVKPYSLTALPDGRFAFILKQGLSFAVCVADSTGKIQTSFSQPAIVPRYLSVDTQNPSILNFTWTKDGTFPRYGSLNIQTGECKLSTKDLSGGVYYPVKALDKIVYIGKYFTQPRILVLEKDEGFETYKLKQAVVKTLSQDEITALKNPGTLEYKKYNPFDYYKRGILIPFSSLSSTSHSKDSTISSSLPIGLSYTSSNPWGDKEFTATVGYGLETNSVGLDAKITGGTDTELFKYTAEAFVEFDSAGFKQTYGTLELRSAFNTGNTSAIGFGAMGNVWYGRSNYKNPLNSFFASLDATSSSWDFYASEIFYMTYINKIKLGPERNSYAGFSLTALLKNADNFGVSGDDWKASYTELGFLSTIYIPSLLPLDCKRGLTYNLPVKVDLNLFTDSKKVGDNIVSDLLSGVSCFYEPVFSLAGLKAEMVLFGTEIQHAIPASSLLWIYLHDFRVSLLYSGGFDFAPGSGPRYFSIKDTASYFNDIKNGAIPYEQYLGLRFYTGLSFNFGMSTKTSLCLDLYPLNTKNSTFLVISFNTEF